MRGRGAATGPPIEVPANFAELREKFEGAAGRAWIAALPRLAADYLERWGLAPDGAVRHGMAALVVPVLRADGTPAVLKLQQVDEESEGEADALRAWNGNGAVRLLDDDPEHGALLLERLDDHRSLNDVPDDTEALQILTGILARLVTLAAPPEMRRLTDIAHAMLDEAPAALTALSGDQRRAADTCVAAVRDLAGDAGDRLLHWDLHYENVLAGGREPWLAIDPCPLAGDPGFDLMPALDNRWDDMVATGDLPAAIRRRFDYMTEVLDLDRRRSAGWTLGRVLQNTLWDLEDGEDGMSDVQRAIAEALLPRM